MSVRAVTVNEYERVPVVAGVPAPQRGPRQVLIKLGTAGVNPMDYFALQPSTELLARLADALVAGGIAAPPITRIKLEEAPDAVSGTDPRRSDGKTVISV